MWACSMASICSAFLGSSSLGPDHFVPVWTILRSRWGGSWFVRT